MGVSKNNGTPKSSILSGNRGGEKPPRKKTYLGGGNSNIFGIFTPIPGEMIQFDEHIFQMGWNHQLVFFLVEDE